MSQNTEFQRFIKADSISKKQSFQKQVTAKPEECEALAKRFGILTVDKLEAQLTLTRERGGTVIKCQGSLIADVSQACVVTLTPVLEHIETEFEGFFSTDMVEIPLDQGVEHGLETLMPEEEDAPEPIINGQIDVGELVAQHLSLSLTSYPKSSEADSDKVLEENDLKPQKNNPFSVLKGLKEE